jgi:hypothetical protein
MMSLCEWGSGPSRSLKMGDVLTDYERFREYDACTVKLVIFINYLSSPYSYCIMYEDRLTYPVT